MNQDSNGRSELLWSAQRLNVIKQSAFQALEYVTSSVLNGGNVTSTIGYQSSLQSTLTSLSHLDHQLVFGTSSVSISLSPEQYNLNFQDLCQQIDCVSCFNRSLTDITNLTAYILSARIFGSTGLFSVLQLYEQHIENLIMMQSPDFSNEHIQFALIYESTVIETALKHLFDLTSSKVTNSISSAMSTHLALMIITLFVVIVEYYWIFSPMILSLSEQSCYSKSLFLTIPLPTLVTLPQILNLLGLQSTQNKLDGSSTLLDSNASAVSDSAALDVTIASGLPGTSSHNPSEETCKDQCDPTQSDRHLSPSHQSESADPGSRSSFSSSSPSSSSLSTSSSIPIHVPTILVESASSSSSSSTSLYPASPGVVSRRSSFSKSAPSRSISLAPSAAAFTSITSNRSLGLFWSQLWMAIQTWCTHHPGWALSLLYFLFLILCVPFLALPSASQSVSDPDFFEIVVTFCVASCFTGAFVGSVPGLTLTLVSLALDRKTTEYRDPCAIVQCVCSALCLVYYHLIGLSVDWPAGLWISLGGCIAYCLGVPFLSNAVDANLITLLFDALWVAIVLGYLLSFALEPQHAERSGVLHRTSGNTLTVELLCMGLFVGTQFALGSAGVGLVPYVLIVLYFRVEEDAVTRSCQVILLIVSGIGFVFRCILFGSVRVLDAIPVMPFAVFFTALGNHRKWMKGKITVL